MLASLGGHSFALTALYRALHPVATREMVKRVAEEMRTGSVGNSTWEIYLSEARAALRAAGFTVEEGA